MRSVQAHPRAERGLIMKTDELGRPATVGRLPHHDVDRDVLRSQAGFHVVFHEAAHMCGDFLRLPRIRPRVTDVLRRLAFLQVQHDRPCCWCQDAGM